MKARRIIMASVALALMVNGAAKAQTTALQHSRYTQDPVAAAMGGAVLTSTSDIACASSGNMAAAAFSSLKMDIAASYQMRSTEYFKENFINASAGFRIAKKAMMAAGFSYGMNPAYDIYDENGVKGGRFKPTDMLASLGFGYRISDIFSAGVNARFINSQLAKENSYSAFGADVLAMAKIPFGTSAFKIAAGVRNAGTSVTSVSGDRFPIPSSATVAFGLESTFALKHRVEVGIDSDYFFRDGLGISAGLSYSFAEYVSVRGGLHCGGLLPNYGSVGLGLGIKGIHLDIAYMLPMNSETQTMTSTLCAGIGYRF